MKFLNTILCFGALAGAEIPQNYRDLNYEASTWQAPDPLAARTVLKQGSPLYLLPDHSLPVVRMHLLFKGPGYGADSNQLAARSLLSSMMVQGGTRTLSGAALVDSLELTAAQMSVQTGPYSTAVQLECLSKDFPAMLKLLREALLQPGFDTSVLRIQKLDLVESIKHRYDRPAPVSSELYQRLLYGKHPVNWDPRPAEVSALRTADFKAQLPYYLDTRKLLIGLSGDFDSQKIKDTLETWLSGWPQSQGMKDSVAAPNAHANPGLFVLDYNSTQTQVRMGAPFVQRPSPDYYAAALAAYILGGGGFGTRLVDRIRTDEGLAYHVGASVGNSYFQVPTVDLVLQTKAPSTARALEIVWEELERMRSTGPTEAELASAKKALIQSLPASFDNAENTIDAFMSNELYGRPMDHYRKFPLEIQALTAAQVQAAARKYFDPSQMTMSLVGPWAEIQKGDVHGFLSKFKANQWKLSDLDRR